MQNKHMGAGIAIGIAIGVPPARDLGLVSQIRRAGLTTKEFEEALR